MFGMLDCNPTLLIVGSSFAGFQLINWAVGYYLTVPESAARNKWKWRNIWTSLFHSVVTGTWAVLCFYFQPRMAEDLISTHSAFSHTLVSVSIGISDIPRMFDYLGRLPTHLIPEQSSILSVSMTGYFINDFTDLLCNQKLQNSWELLFHHSVVITCFGISVRLSSYVGFAVVALLVEINSVFLHLRQILLMTNLGQSTLFRVNSMANLGTYVVFRMNTLAWMTRWLVLNRGKVPLVTYTIGSVGMAIMTLMNIVLFYRLLRSDFLKSSRKAKREK